ncbi:MAG: DUF6075 family protein [Mediterraneibacter gnavus]
MSEIRFSSRTQKFLSDVSKMRKARQLLQFIFYCVGISEDTRNHVDRMFDFKERLIKPGALHEGCDRQAVRHD